MKTIRILGTGCHKCKQLFANAHQAVENTGANCEIVKVTDVNEIMKFGVMITPALVVDEKVVSAGKVLASEKIEGFLK